MYQRWSELLFLHWPFDPAVIQATLPPGLRVDLHAGQAWVGVVPFFMTGVRPRFCPAVPGLSSFQELNLRTYVVDAQGRPGVWFYSLDTSHRLPVWIARRFFHLNYLWARMSADLVGGNIRYVAQRQSAGPDNQQQVYQWSRVGEAAEAQVGSLEFFLVERYRLFAYNEKTKRLYSGRVYHAPYRVQSVDLKAYSQELFRLDGLPVPAGDPVSVLGVEAVDVRIFPLSAVEQ